MNNTEFEKECMLGIQITAVSNNFQAPSFVLKASIYARTMYTTRKTLKYFWPTELLMHPAIRNINNSIHAEWQMTEEEQKLLKALHDKIYHRILTTTVLLQE